MLLLNSGCVYPGEQGGERLVAFEASLIELQLQMEQTFFNIARSTGRHSVILYDRGLLDVAAYLPRALWPRVLNFNQWVRDGMLGVLERYDLIVHLVTAADGAPEHFRRESIKHHTAGSSTTASSSATSLAQDLADAKELDDRIRESYRGHPQHFVVDNSTGFDEKLDKVFQHLDAVLSKQ